MRPDGSGTCFRCGGVCHNESKPRIAMSTLDNLSEEQGASNANAASENTNGDSSSFADILSEYEKEHTGDPGERLHGTVVTVTADKVVVDIGRKMEGVV